MAASPVGTLLALALVASPPHDPEHRLAAVSARLLRTPNDVALRVERARLHLVLGDLDAARGDLEVAQRLAPEDGATIVTTAVLEARAGNDVAALLACRHADERGIADRSLLRLRGRVLQRLRRPAEAAAAFHEAMAGEAVTEPTHWLELAAATSATGDDAAARVLLGRALRQLGPVVALVDAAVECDLRLRRFDAALAAVETLRPFARCQRPVHQRRARVLTAAGAWELAAAELHAAERVDEGGEDSLLPAPAAPPAPRAPTTAAVDAGLPPTPPQVLVPLGATWRYFDQGTLPALDWFLPTYDDTGWAAGPAQLGYGDGDEATVVQSGPVGAVYPTTWFRHGFSVANPAALPSARVRVLCDDGVVVYVNGVEVGRWNLHTGPVLPISPASVAVTGAAENDFHVFAFDPALLVPGVNVIAAEIHQVSPTSSDISFDCEMLAGSGPITVLRGPYLQNGRPTAATVRWRTDQPTSTQLWVGSSATTLQPVWFDATPKLDHEAVVTGLQTKTTYAYAIGDAAGVFAAVPSATLTTLPPAGAQRPMRAWVLGDMGISTASQYAVRDAWLAYAGGQRPDLILMLGDNAYPTGTDADYQLGVFDVYGLLMRDTFTWSALGNHDAMSVNTAAQVGPYYDIFSLPRVGEAGGLPSGTEAYYSFDRGHVHFVCLDSMDSDRTATGAMMTWLQADLAAANARWLVAFFHHPPYSAGSHDSDNPLDSGGRMTDMRQVALPILEAAGVDLVLSGHSHSYERSFLLDGHYGPGASLAPAMVRDRGDGIDQGDGAYAKAAAGLAPHQGAVYVVAGSAAAAGGGALNHPAMHVSLDHLGSFVFDIDGDRLDARFVGLAGVEDEFTLVKGAARTLFRDQPRISVGAGGRQDFTLAAGPQHANRFYVLAGALGTTPGLPLGTLLVPLNPDPWLQLSLALANSPVYPGSIGVLDATGRATAAFVLPPLNDPSLVGQALWHAYVVGDGTSFVHASNAVKMTFAP